MTVIKKPGDTITITLGIGIPLDGETWTYGIGCSLIDSAGTSWDFTSFSTIVKGGTTIQSQYMEKNKNYSCIFSAKIPADAAEGLIDVVGAVWKKTKDLTESDRIIDATEEDAYDYQKKTWKMSLSMTVA